MNANLVRLTVILGTAALAVVFPPQTIPIRQLNMEATSAVNVYVVGTVIELSDGRVLLNERAFQNPRLILFDAKLATATTVGDSTTLSSGPRSRTLLSFTPIRFRGDSTVLPDPNGNTLMILDPKGKNANVMTMPRPTDAGIVTATAGFDEKFRLVYRGSFPRKPTPPSPTGGISLPPQPDSFPIVRADFDSRAIDTIATVHWATGLNSSISMEQGRMTIKTIRQPLPNTDDWVVLSDGTVAIVRGADYHVDWIHADGTHASTPKMPFDWRRLTDEDKQHLVDSLKALDERNKVRLDSAYAARGETRPPSPSLTEYAPLKEWPDYYPPIRATGGVAADRDAHLWILPTTSAQARGGPLYDIVNQKGEIFERVQLPTGCALAGFGVKSRVYLTCSEKAAGDTVNTTHLKRMQIVR